MTLIVAELLAKLGVDDTGFSSSMQGAQGQYQATARSASQMAQSVEKSAAKVQSARASEQAAAVRVQAAEQALNNLRASGTTDALKLAQAESKLQSALAAQNSAAVRAAEAARGLSAAQRAQSSAGDRVASANQKVISSTNNLAQAANVAKGALAAMGIGFSLNQVVQGLTQSVQAARALGAQTNQMNVIFGEGKAEIQQWGSTAAQTMRMSQREAQGAAIQFATFGKAMGLTGDQLVTFSKEQSKLAADLASFQGIPVAEAIQAMGSAYAGETETMRQYGVLIDDNTLKQTALAHGMQITGGNLTQVQKSQAIYLAMQEQLAYVNGDVERSNGKFGASLKTLTANLEETQAVVGQKLIPVVQPFVDLLAGPGLGAVEGIAGAVGAAGSAFGSLPGPVQAALAGVVAWKLGTTVAMRVAGDQITGLRDRASGAFSNMQQSMSNMQRAAAVSGRSMSNFGAGIAVIGRNVPILDRMRTSFIEAAAGAERFPRSAGLAAGAMTGMKGAASGLLGVMGGPWGLAIAGATAALGVWMSKKQEDQTASEAAKNATQEWADVLTQSNGAIDANVKKFAAKKIAETDAYKTAEKLGISQEELTNKVLEGRDAYDAWYAAMYRKGKDSGKWRESDMAGMAGEVQRIAEQFDEGKDKALQMAKGTGDVKVSFDGSSKAAGAMSQAMVEFSESTDGAASKVDKLSKALNTLRDDRLTEEEALQASSSAIKDLAEAWGQVDAAAVKADGSINFDTPDAIAKYGALQDKVVDLGKTYDQTAAAAMEHARAENMGPAEALDYVRSKVDPLRQSLIDQATAAGVSAEAAERMADRYLGVPSEILTKLDLQGTEAAIAKLNQVQVKGAQPVQGKYTMVDNTPEVRAKLDYLKIKYSVIDGKLVISDEDAKKAQSALETLGVTTETLPDGFVKITDTSDANIARLKALGIEVQRLPDGTIVINPDDAEFWRRVTKAQEDGRKKIYVDMIQRGASDWEAEFHANLVQKSQEQGLSNADGSITEYASGGVRPAGVQSMPDQAIIEKGRGRGLVRWAEGETWWESYIPGAPSKRKRSTAILSETARRFGYGLVPFDAMRGVLSILQRGDYTSSLSSVGIEEDSAVVDFLMKRRAGQKDSPLTSLQKDIAALMTGGGALLRGQYDGVLSRRFNIEEDSPWIAQFFGPRGPSMMRAYADGAITGGTVQLGNISGEGITTGEQQSMWDAVRSKFGDAVLSSATRSVQTEGHADYHNAGRAIDISGPSMGAIAAWIAQTYPDSMELIHSPFSHNIKDGKDVGDGMSFYGAGTMSGHQDHVHWALGHDATVGANGAGAQQIQDVTLTQSSSREDVARKIIAEGRKRGYTDDQIKAVLATAIQESNLDPGASGGGGAWHGIFQQDESYEGRDDPNANVTGFYDRLDEKRAADPDADIYDQIFWLQQRPGESSAADAVANGRQGYLSEIKSQDDAAAKMLADIGPSVGTGADTGASDSGVGSQVYVTGGHLDSVGSGYTPSATTSSTSDSTTSTTSSSTQPAPERKRLFTLGGNRWPFYNGSPEQPKAEKSSPDTTSKTKKGPAAPSESSIAAAQAAVEKAKRSQAEAVEKQRIAEMRLDEVRSNPKAKPSQIAAAEESVARAKNAVTDATDKQRVAEMRLQEIQNKQAAATTQSAPPVKRLNGGTIPGVGRGDIIPMMGEPGEEVIRRPVAERYRGALQHLNRTGRWPEHHQEGGTVGGFTSGFGGYTDPAVAKVGILDHAPGYYLEQLYRLGVAGYGGAAMAASAIGPDGSFQGLSTGSASFPILDDIAQKLDEVIKEGRVGSIGIYVGEGGQIVVEDMGKLRQTQDKAVGDAMMRSAAMRA
ncbi:tape measure protein [Gordonia phage Finkle]|uniref:Tape measure protein n=1 Tax=Gordonia phage Finkle TaxID=2926099 RepID=A0A9E7NIK3_9CAUD|nr:tape measure protein [Gordonia phage Finkle]UTN92936.1 tape measure protein [Gordonia phage Finkle]